MPKPVAKKTTDGQYRAYVQKRLSQLSDIFANAAVGDFSKDLKIPAKADEFSELFAGLQIMIEVIREKTGELEALNYRLASEIREKAAEIKAIVENSPQFIIQIDRSYKIIYINRLVAGITLKQAMGSNVLDFLGSPADRKKMKALYDKAFATGKPESTEFESVGANGGKAWYKAGVGPVVEDGKVQSLIVVSTDITDIKESDQKLRDSEERFRAITESVSDAIVSANSDGNIILFNQGASRLFGFSSTEALGKPLTIIMPQEFTAAHKKGLQNYVKTKKAKVIGHGAIELQGKRKDGSVFPVELTLSKWESGGKLFFTGIMRDVTERRKIEDTVSQRTQELEKFNALMIGRELKMTELKREINELRKRLGLETETNDAN